MKIIEDEKEKLNDLSKKLEVKKQPFSIHFIIFF